MDTPQPGPTEALPIELQWVAAIISFVAFAMGTMALPTILQMFFGRPRVALEFERHAMGKERALIVYLKNPPVRNWLLRKVGVRRDAAQSVSAVFTIMEAGGGTIVDPIRHAGFHQGDEDPEKPRTQIVLPPTYSIGANFMVAMWDDENKGVIVPPDRLRSAFVISPGRYRVGIALVVDGNPQKEERQFVVGEGPDALVWVGG